MQKNKASKIAIIGAGASGVASAISALREINKANSDIEVHLFDINKTPGKPILKTGNGRCNFCNRKIYTDKYWNGDFAKHILDANANLIDTSTLGAYECSDYSKLTLSFMESLGLLWNVDNVGNLYPYTNRAISVLNVFNRELKIYKNFTFHPESNITEMPQDFDNIIICTGKNTDILKGLPDQHIIEPTGVLCPIEVYEEYVKKLDNIRTRARVNLVRDGEIIELEIGELLFRKYGVSGICIFNLSRYAKPDDILRINFLPEFSNNLYQDLMKSRLYNHDYMDDPADALAGIVLPEIAQVTKGNLRDFELTVKSLHLSDGQAQTVRGGIDVSEVDDHLKLKNVTDKNVYVAGEIIDVDGPCGGYNLNWAFASGIIAGFAAVSNIIKS